MVSPILSCLPLRFLSAFSLRFSILRYERLFRICNGLETRVNWVYQSKEPIYILLYFISFCGKFYDILETKNGIRESDEKSAGSTRDFREKGAGMRDQHPLLSPPPPPPSSLPSRPGSEFNISTEMAEMVQAQQITAVYRKTVYFTHQGKYILGLGKEQNVLIYSRFYKYHGRFRRYCTCC